MGIMGHLFIVGKMAQPAIPRRMTRMSELGSLGMTGGASDLGMGGRSVFPNIHEGNPFIRDLSRFRSPSAVVMETEIPRITV